jgi:hypothetical protein
MDYDDDCGFHCCRNYFCLRKFWKGCDFVDEAESEDNAELTSAKVIQRAWRKYSLRTFRKNLELHRKKFSSCLKFLKEEPDKWEKEWDEDTRYGWTWTHGLPPTFPGVILKKEGYFFTCYLKCTPYQRDGKAPLGNRLLFAVEPPLVKVSKVTATYDYVGLESLWNIKGDLDNAHDWGIKWDTLHVQWKEGDKYVEYEPNDSASDLFEDMGCASQDSEDELSSHYDFKRPNNTKLVVEEMTVEEADAECDEP